MCTGLLAVTLDLFASTLIAGSGDSTSFLYGLGGRDIADRGAIIDFKIGFNTVGRRRRILDRPVRHGQRGGLVVRHVDAESGAGATIELVARMTGVERCWG